MNEIFHHTSLDYAGFLLDEGWKWDEFKARASMGSYLTLQKVKRFFGLNHNFTREEINRRNEIRFKAMIDGAKTAKDLDELIHMLETWASNFKDVDKLVADANDRAEVKSLNQAVIHDHKILVLKTLQAAKTKRSKMK